MSSVNARKSIPSRPRAVNWRMVDRVD
jgi:hypothetical protein